MVYGAHAALTRFESVDCLGLTGGGDYGSNPFNQQAVFYVTRPSENYCYDVKETNVCEVGVS